MESSSVIASDAVFILRKDLEIILPRDQKFAFRFQTARSCQSFVKLFIETLYFHMTIFNFLNIDLHKRESGKRKSDLYRGQRSLTLK